MTKLFSRIKWMLILTGLASLFLNFTNPKLARQSASAVSEVIRDASKSAAQAVGADFAEKDEKLYVQIDGKLYEYNPNGVYTVDGVRTLYKNGHPRTKRELAMAETSAGGDAGVDQMLMNNPQSVYTPEGVQKVMEGARAAKAKMEERNRALEQLDRE